MNDEARPVLVGDPPPPCTGQRHYAVAKTGEDGRKTWVCITCTHVLRPFYANPWGVHMSKLPLTDQEVHEIAEAVMDVLMPRFEEALERMYGVGRRDGLTQAGEMLDAAELP